MKSNTIATVCLLSFLVLLMVPNLPFAPIPQRVAGDTISSVYVTPVQTCCILPSSSLPVFTVNVTMNLNSAEMMNGFDVRLNYTNWYVPGPPPAGVVKAISLDYSKNVFATSGYQVTTQASCIDDVTYATSSFSGFCATDDVVGGQVHVAQTLLGGSLQGPVSSALLFSVTFSVNATGTSLMYLERAHLENPGTGTSPNPTFIQVVTGAGVFGNDPLVAFFDYSSTVSPSVLSGVNARFNASSSFRSTVSGKMALSGPMFKWNFGDGTTTAPTSNPVITHSFLVPGNYTVGLVVNDTNPGGGYIARVVQVVPPLGNLHIFVRPQAGAVLPGTVTVKLYNLTSTVLTLCRACNQTLDTGGTADIRGLVPGTYSMNFTGVGIDPASKQTQVQLGWTTMETVYVTVIQPPGPNTIGLEIFGAIVGGGLGLVSLALFVRWRKNRRLKSGGSLAKKAKPARH